MRITALTIFVLFAALAGCGTSEPETSPPDAVAVDIVASEDAPATSESAPIDWAALVDQSIGSLPDDERATWCWALDNSTAASLIDQATDNAGDGLIHVDGVGTYPDTVENRAAYAQAMQAHAAQVC